MQDAKLESLPSVAKGGDSKGNGHHGEKDLMDQEKIQETTKLEPVLPKHGLVYSEKTNMSEILCKPKVMPIPPQTFRHDSADSEEEENKKD